MLKLSYTINIFCLIVLFNIYMHGNTLAILSVYIWQIKLITFAIWKEVRFYDIGFCNIDMRENKND